MSNDQHMRDDCIDNNGTRRRDLLIGSGALVVAGHGIVKVLSSCIGFGCGAPTRSHAFGHAV